MILASTRVRSGDAGRAVAYLLDHGQPEIITGDATVAQDADIRAALKGGTYSLRHWQLSPDEPISRRELAEAVSEIRAEFELGNRSLFVVQHESVRADLSSVPHYHLVAPEYDEHGRVLCSRHSWARQEKIARQFEIKFGHRVLMGRHHQAVIARLEQEGDLDVAAALRATADLERPRAAYNRPVERAAHRHGVDLPVLVEALKGLRQTSVQELGRALADIEDAHGVRFAQGVRRGGQGAQPLVITAQDGTFLCSASRPLQSRRKDTPEILRSINHARNHLDNDPDRFRAQQLQAYAHREDAVSIPGCRRGSNTKTTESTGSNRAVDTRNDRRPRRSYSPVGAAAAFRAHPAAHAQPSPIPVAAILDAAAALRAWAEGMKLQLRLSFNAH